MNAEFCDIHPHVISQDLQAYPPSPLFGKQSDWSKERPTTIDTLIAELDAAGIAKAAIVQSSTCYGHDNSYVCDAAAAHPDRFTAVGNVDMMAGDAIATIETWRKRGLTGLRLFTGGSTKAFDTAGMDDPKSFAVWEYCGAEGLPICIQTGPVGLAQVAGLAKRFPRTAIVLDHLARPVLEDGAPYAKAGSLFAMAAFDNIFLKITPRTTDLTRSGEADPQSFFTRLVSEFGAERLAWGSNFPASEGSIRDNLAEAQAQLAFLPDAAREMIFAGTAKRLYPALAGSLAVPA